jgi:uncharacterized protein (TIGR03437 family)
MRTRKTNLRYRLTVLIVLVGLLTSILTSDSPLSLAANEARRSSPPTDKVGAVATSQSKSSFPDKPMPVGANQVAALNSKSRAGHKAQPQICNYSVSPSFSIYSSSGGSNSIGISTNFNCGWIASRSASWIRIIFGGGGNGPGTTGYSVDPNTGPSRSGTITIIGDNGNRAFHDISQSGTTPNISSVNAASFVAPVAPESLVAGFGSGLAGTTQTATTIPLPTTLGGRSVKVTDSALISRDAPLLFVSPTQINYQMPAGTAVGTATVTVVVSPGGATVAQGSVQVATVAPGMFAISGSGDPPTASGQWLRYSGGVQVASGSLDTPIVFGGPGDTVFLILYGTGIRFRSSLSAVSVTAGGSGTVVEYAGAQGTFVGQDQINAILPQSLAGAGEINVVVTVDSVTANTVKVTAGT